MKRTVVYLDDVLFDLYAINVNSWKDEKMDRMIKFAIDNIKRRSFEIETDSNEGDIFGGNKDE